MFIAVLYAIRIGHVIGSVIKYNPQRRIPNAPQRTPGCTEKCVQLFNIEPEALACMFRAGR